MNYKIFYFILNLNLFYHYQYYYVSGKIVNILIIYFIHLNHNQHIIRRTLITKGKLVLHLK